MPAMPPNRRAMAASHMTAMAVVRGNAMIRLERIITKAPRPICARRDSLYRDIPVTICSMPNRNKIIAAAKNVATVVITGYIIAEIDSPIARAPMPICRALIHDGDFAFLVLTEDTKSLVQEVELKDSKAYLE